MRRSPAVYLNLDYKRNPIVFVYLRNTSFHFIGTDYRINRCQLRQSLLTTGSSHYGGISCLLAATVLLLLSSCWLSS
jgi:hypothetical protein